MEGLVILSVFNGMNCGRIALESEGIKINKYYSSEIDESANKITNLINPDTINLGDITKIKGIDLPKIDLFIGGSPCQGFSFIGNMLNFEDPQSKLFFEYVRLWNEIKAINPEAKFLLENVKMKKQHLRIISEYLGVFPKNIDSSLVSGQKRSRWYWTNIKTEKIGFFDELYVSIPDPKEKGILLKDILDIDVDEKYFLTLKQIKRGIKKHSPQTLNSVRRTVRRNMGKVNFPTLINSKAKTLLTLVIKGGRDLNHILTYEGIRILTPKEYGLLQTIPNDILNIILNSGLSDAELYKLFGNGWTVDVIAHIFSFLKDNNI